MDEQEIANPVMVMVQPQNPLLMQDVLKRIFEYLNVKCVWKCRQVCMEWNIVASPIFQRRIREIEIVFDPDRLCDPISVDEEEQEDADDHDDLDDENDKDPTKENNSVCDVDVVPELPNEYNPIYRYMQMIESSPFNFTTFAFEHWDMDEKWAQTFFSLQGQHIVKLRLNYSTYLREECDLKSKQLGDILLKHAPNIEELHLIVPSIQNSPIFETDSKPVELKIKRLTIGLNLDERIKVKRFGYSACTQEFLTDLFKPSKNLDSVTIYEYSETNNSEYADGRFDTIPILTALIDTGRVKGLKELNLANITGEIFQLLGSERFLSSECQLAKFTTLGESEIDFDGDGIDWMKFESFLNSQKDSLEYLSIHLTTRKPRYSQISELKFPTMKKLKTLELHFDIESDEPYRGIINLEPFDFGTQFPGLIELKIYGADNDWHNEEYQARVLESMNSSVLELFPLGSSSRCSSLKKLNLENLTFPNSAAILQIGELFPNLAYLDFGYQTDQVITTLWTACPNLTSLNMELDAMGTETRPYIMDSIFTGLPEDFCRMYQLHRNLVEKNESPQYLDTDEYLKLRTRPGISNLTKLRTLFIHFRLDHEPAGQGQGQHFSPNRMLSDVSGRLGLMKLSKLTSIYVGDHCHQISDECVDEMCTYLGFSKPVKCRWSNSLSLGK